VAQELKLSLAFEPFVLSMHTTHAGQPRCLSETFTGTTIIQSVACFQQLGTSFLRASEEPVINHT